MAVPNAFLVGVPKAGTTSLARYLDQHPDVFLAKKKEPNFHLCAHERPNVTGPAPEAALSFLLHRSTVTDADEYEALYEEGTGAAIRLDASVRYLYHHDVTLPSIRAAAPQARVIAVLRDPTERIVSHWRMNRQYQLEPLDLGAALAAERSRTDAGWGYDWHYAGVSTYGPQLRALYDTFLREQVLVLLYGDLVRDPEGTIRRTFDHLGVDPDFAPDRSDRGRVPTEPRSALVDRLVNWPGRVRTTLWNLPRAYGRRIIQTVDRWNATQPAPLPPGATVGIAERFVDDHVDCAELLGLAVDEYRTRLAGRPA